MKILKMTIKVEDRDIHQKMLIKSFSDFFRSWPYQLSPFLLLYYQKVARKNCANRGQKVLCVRW